MVKCIFFYSTFLIVSCFTLSVASAATISFFAVSDPQFTFGDDIRATKTLRDVALLARQCLDCTKVVPIAGDLSMGKKGRSLYGHAYQLMEAQGIKPLDGTGNHDTKPFADDATSFGQLSQLFQGEEVKGDSISQQGWQIFHHSATLMKVDGGDCDTNDFYCGQAKAYYYTVKLQNPMDLSGEAYLVQLHNNLYSKSATEYLRQLIEDKGPELAHAPIFLVAHQMTLDNIQGGSIASKRALNTIISRQNVVAIIHGHDACLPVDKQYFHCNVDHNQLSQTVNQWGASFINVYGVAVPRFNVSAAFYGIFWAFRIDTHTNQLSYKRFNQAYLGNARRYTGTLADIITELPSLTHNMPFKSDDFVSGYLRQSDPHSH